MSQDITTHERRVTHRLTSYWNSLRQGSELPNHQHLEHISSSELQDIWDCCFVVGVEQITEGANNYTYSHIGKAIRTAYESAELQPEQSPPLASLRASKLHQAYRQLLETRRPVMLEGECTNARGEVVKYRQCLVPFIGRRNEVAAILGGMRFKREARPALAA